VAEPLSLRIFVPPARPWVCVGVSGPPGLARRGRHGSLLARGLGPALGGRRSRVPSLGFSRPRFALLPARPRAVGLAPSSFAAPGRSLAARALASLRCHLARDLARGRAYARLSLQVHALPHASRRSYARRAGWRVGSRHDYGSARAGWGPGATRPCPRFAHCVRAVSFVTSPHRALDATLRAAPAPGQNITRSL